MRELIQLTKPTITLWILLTGATGFITGSRGQLDGWKLLAALVGLGLMASGTAALNQWLERDVDKLMRRTAGRPLPAGRLQPWLAVTWGLFLAGLGFWMLLALSRPMAAYLGLFTLASYLLIYTPLKRRTPWSTTAGAVPGAMPPLIGYTSATGSIGWEGVLLALVLFLWQFPHFHSIAWIYREDYARGGIRMKPVVVHDLRVTAREMLVTSLLLVPASLLLAAQPALDWIYLAGALGGAGLMIWASWSALCSPTRQRAKRVLVASLVYLPVFCAFVGLDWWLR